MLSRRHLVGATLGGVTAAMLAGPGLELAIPREASAQSTLSPDDALQSLMDGNRRFVERRLTSFQEDIDMLLQHTAEKQEPFASVLACADSRVPVELVFDQGLGDLFVIRVAGNVVAPSQIGSVEYAVEQLGTRLVVVLGHTGCGAVQATLDVLQHSAETPSRNLGSIVDRIRPAVEGLLATELRRDREALARQAVRANVRVAANALRHGSHLLERRIENDGLLVVGAEYDLETGVVELFDGVPEAG